jgi:hypothetical protein
MAGDVCSKCGAEVRRVITIGTIVRDLDPSPRPDGNHIIITRDNGSIRAQVLTGPEMPYEGDAYRKHECPAKPRPGPPCARCTLPMDRELALLERWTDHPCCDSAHHIERLRRTA